MFVLHAVDTPLIITIEFVPAWSIIENVPLLFAELNLMPSMEAQPVALPCEKSVLLDVAVLHMVTMLIEFEPVPFIPFNLVRKLPQVLLLTA